MPRHVKLLFKGLQIPLQDHLCILLWRWLQQPFPSGVLLFFFLFSSMKILLWLKNIVFLTLSLPKVLHWHARISRGSFQWYCWPRWGFITFEYKACCGCTSKWPCYSFSLIEEKNSAFQSNCWNFIKLTDFTVEQLTCTLNMVWSLQMQNLKSHSKSLS